MGYESVNIERERAIERQSDREKEKDRAKKNARLKNRQLRHAKLESVICSSLDRFQVSIVHK